MALRHAPSYLRSLHGSCRLLKRNVFDPWSKHATFTRLTSRAFSEKAQRDFIQVTQFRAADCISSHDDKDVQQDQQRLRKATVYSATGTASQWTTMNPKTEEQNQVDNASFSLSQLDVRQYAFDKVIKHFLPAQYPHSVAEGYARFCLLAFSASVAGSAAMVLSTQTLLLAVGVVGANSAQSASIMAGALNWVLKDGIGQLGGVVFASRMGHTKRFDSDPKRWRMLAALSLDGATLMEILSPLVMSSMVLPVACVANIGKNIGFLTASASRAAIHQSLARRGNLADVTAKSGTQSMAAGLLGTALGIGLSSVLQHDATNFIAGFCVLSAIHQGSNYVSLKAVPLRHFNRHRLHWVLSQYCFGDASAEANPQQSTPLPGEIFTPPQVAAREQFFPLSLSPGNDSHAWLSIGSPLTDFCPGSVEDFQQLHEFFHEEQYLLNIVEGGRIHLIFQDQATGDDLILGMYHAYQLRHDTLQSEGAQDNTVGLAAIAKSYKVVKEGFPKLLEDLHHEGWMTGTDVTNIEPGKAFRLSIESKS